MIKYLSIIHMAKNILRKQFGNIYSTNKPVEQVEAPSKSGLPPIESPTFTGKGIVLFTLLLIISFIIYFNWDPILKFLKRIYTDFKPVEQVDKAEEKYSELTKNSKLLEDILNMEKRIMGRMDSSEKMNKETSEMIEKIRKDLEEKIAAKDPAGIDALKSKLEELEKKPVDNSKIDELKGKLDGIEKKPMDTSKLDEIRSKLEELKKNDPTNEEMKKRLNTLEEKEKNRIKQEKNDKKGGINKLDERLSKYKKDQLVNYSGYCYIGYDRNQRECANVYEGDICMSGQIFPSLEVCLNPNM